MVLTNPQFFPSEKTVKLLFENNKDKKQNTPAPKLLPCRASMVIHYENPPKKKSPKWPFNKSNYWALF